ncbi:hypothetical protein BKI52_06180 [marine bacterium AO1-C]|nr:hypothetical protein BKI52_06180 [marine bacterium AO1-C]
MRLLKLIVASVGLTLIFTASSFCQKGKIQFETTKLSDHAYILTRTWGAPHQKSNIGVVIGEKGLAIINASFFKGEVEQVLGAFRKISPKPIKWVINSNWDMYNVASNQYFKNKDVTIISQENVAYQNNAYTQLTFKDKFSLNVGTETIVAYRSYGHSFGHINIHLVNANATFMSDSYRSQWMTTTGPYGLKGHFKGIDMALAMGNQHTKYIPGNTTQKIVCDKDDLIKEKKRRSAFSRRVLQLKKLRKLNKEILADTKIISILKEYPLYPYIIKEIGDWVINPLFFDEQAKKHILSQKQLEKYVGTYSCAGKNDVEVFIKDGELFSRSVGQFYVKSVPTSTTHFWYEREDLSLHQVFKMDSANHVTGFTIKHNDQTLTYVRKP